MTKERDMNKVWIQVSVDTQDLATARIHAEHAVAIDAEWVEVGTPLLTFEGINSIKFMSDLVPDRVVLADFKALDGVSQYFTKTGELGGKVATVMAVANEASILQAIKSGHEAGVEIQVDMLGTPVEKLSERVKEIEALGADYILLHLSIDELMRNPAADSLEGLEQLVSASSLPVGVVVFSKEEGVAAIQGGASYLVIGYPLIVDENARSLMTEFAETVRSAADALG